MNKHIRIGLVLVIVIGAILAFAERSTANTWAVGNTFGLCQGAEIRIGSGFDYSVHTIVPEDNWLVMVIDGPRYIDGETWWDIDRAAAGDPSGGSGWIYQNQAEDCSYNGGGENSSGGNEDIDNSGSRTSNIQIIVETSGDFFSADGQGGRTSVDGQTSVIIPYRVSVYEDGQPVDEASVRLVAPFSASIGLTDNSGSIDASISVPHIPTVGTFEVEIEATVGNETLSQVSELFTVSQYTQQEWNQLTEDEATAYTFAALSNYASNANIPCSDYVPIPVWWAKHATHFCLGLDMLGVATQILPDYTVHAPRAGDIIESTGYIYNSPNISPVWAIHIKFERPGMFLFEETIWADNVINEPFLQRRLLAMTLHSPATLQLTDPDGRVTGIEPQTGEPFFGFPASVGALGDEPFLFVVPSPKEGEYELKIIGTDSGDYSLDIMTLNNDGYKVSELQSNGTTKIGQIDQYTFSLDEELNVYDILPPVTTGIADGDRDSNGIFRSNVTVTLHAEDLSGIDYIEYSLDNGERWHQIPGNNGRIVLSGNGLTQLLYRAIDKAGNTETIKNSGPIIINKYVLFAYNNNANCGLRILSSTAFIASGDLHSNSCVEIADNTGVDIAGAITSGTGVNRIEGNTNSNLVIESGINVDMLSYSPSFYKNLSSVVFPSDLFIDSVDKVISGTIYVEGDVIANATTLGSFTTFIAEGDFVDSSTNGTFSNSDPQNGVAILAKGNILLKGTGNQSLGLFYAPEGTIFVDGGTNLIINGSFVADQIEINGATGLNLTYETGFSQSTHSLPLSNVPFATLDATLPPLPSAPSMVNPNDDDAVILPKSIIWNPVTEAFGYQVQMSVSHEFEPDEIIIDASHLGTYHRIEELADGIYYMRVRAINQAGNSPWSDIQQITIGNLSTQTSPSIETPAPSANNVGVTYRYFEGSWSELPNFDELSEINTGVVSNFLLAPREQNDNFGFVFDGCVRVETAGTFKFYTSSDDGSKLYVNGIEVVDNDGLHAFETRSGEIDLDIGEHVIRVTYFEQGGGEELSVEYEGPGLDRQVIPDSVLTTTCNGVAPSDLVQADPPAQLPSNVGVTYRYFEGSWSELPNFDELPEIDTGVVSNFLLAPREQNDNFGFVFDGCVRVETAGTFTFYTSSDDGSKLYVNGIEVVDNDGLHAFETRSGEIDLDIGEHVIRVTYFEQGGGEELSVEYEGPGLGRQVIPDSVLTTTCESGEASNPVWPKRVVTEIGSASDFVYSVVDLNNTAVQMLFEPTVPSDWVDAHYRINNGAQQNVRMIYNTDTGYWEWLIPHLIATENISVWFTYEKGGLAYDSDVYVYLRNNIE